MSLSVDLIEEFTGHITDEVAKTRMIAHYNKLAGHINNYQGPAGTIGEILTGTVNGVNAVFTTSVNFVPGKVIVYVNGIRQKIIDDYQLSNDNTVTFTFSPLPGEVLSIDY
jgi:hypothetical protein